MNAREWLATRQPRPPVALAERIDARLALVGESDDVPDLLVSAAGDTLESLLRLEANDRAVAIDLLAADALATYAFEAAADEPETLERRATEAMSRLSRIIAAP